MVEHSIDKVLYKNRMQIPTLLGPLLGAKCITAASTVQKRLNQSSCQLGWRVRVPKESCI